MDLNEKTTNLAGGAAHKHDDPLERLRMVTINNLLENRYYESDEESLQKLRDRFKDAVPKDSEFPLQLAAWARQEAYIRDVPQVLLVFAAYDNATQRYVTEYAPEIIRRADELCTVLAFSNMFRNGSPDDFSGNHPGVLVTALSNVIESRQFDEYQYAKYKNENSAVSLHDVLNVARPFDEHVDWADKITKGRKDDHPDIDVLRQRRTWEDRLSEHGNDPDVWRDVLDDMGLFARIRNLRNMLEAGLTGEEILEDVDDEWIQNSKLYPFRFYQARKALMNTDTSGRPNGTMDEYAHRWLENAIRVSVESIPELHDTLTAVDLSGSMHKSMSKNSDLEMAEIGALFGAMLSYRQSDVMAFGTDAKWFTRDPLNDNVLQHQQNILDTKTGSSTHAHKVLLKALNKDELWDRVVVFTDFQIWSKSRFGNNANAFKEVWSDYRSAHHDDPQLYIVDLASYGEIKMPTDYPGVTRIQGWNSKILDYIWYNENSMLEDIRK